jgi:hypothetical protein
MSTKQPCCLVLVFCCLLLWKSPLYAAAPQPVPENEKQPAISIPEHVGTTIAQNAANVRTEIEKRAGSLFDRTPIGWNWDTIDYLYNWGVGLPLKLPEFIKQIMEQSRVLGVVGSSIVFIFFAAVFYSLLGRKRIIARIEKKMHPLQQKIPQALYPFFLSALKVVVSALIPLILLAAYSLINAMILYQADWFELTGKLMVLGLSVPWSSTYCGSH